jgi:hypothetical protein
MLSRLALGADDGELARLRAENARLQARVQELEAENAGLRARAGTVDAAANRSITTSVDEERAVTSLDVEPTRLELTGGNRSRHWVALHAERGTGAAAGGAAVIEIEAAASNGAYRAVRQLELSLDGTPLELPVATRRAAPIVAGPTAAAAGRARDRVDYRAGGGRRAHRRGARGPRAPRSDDVRAERGADRVLRGACAAPRGVGARPALASGRRSAPRRHGSAAVGRSAD